VNRAVVSPAIIEKRGGKKGLSIKRIPFHSPNTGICRNISYTDPQIK
jgi:hypothetical protein